jgi:hypothetical protein
MPAVEFKVVFKIIARAALAQQSAVGRMSPGGVYT